MDLGNLAKQLVPFLASYFQPTGSSSGGGGGGASDTSSLVFLTDPLTDADWDGDDSKAPATYTIDSSAWGVPAGVRACLVQLNGQWAAASGASLAALRPKDGSLNVGVIRAQVAGISNDMTIWVPCDQNGDFDVVVANATMTSVRMRIWGYAP